MSAFKENLRKFRFAIESALLLTLAVYVTVQASELRNSSAAPASAPAERSMASTTSTVPEYLNYQGYLTNSGGAPLDGAYPIKFSIYDAATGGVELWTESHISVEVNEGRVAVLLGSINPISPTLFANYKDTFIGVTVAGDPEMTPRQRIHSVPYAMVAQALSAGTRVAAIGMSSDFDTSAVSWTEIPGLTATVSESGLYLIMVHAVVRTYPATTDADRYAVALGINSSVIGTTYTSDGGGPGENSTVMIVYDAILDAGDMVGAYIYSYAGWQRVYDQHAYLRMVKISESP